MVGPRRGRFVQDENGRFREGKLKRYSVVRAASHMLSVSLVWRGEGVTGGRAAMRGLHPAQMLAATGVFMLWIGWYGFNPGSTGAVTHGKVTVSAHAALTTSLAAAASVFTCVGGSWSHLPQGAYGCHTHRTLLRWLQVAAIVHGVRRRPQPVANHERVAGRYDRCWPTYSRLRLTAALAVAHARRVSGRHTGVRDGRLLVLVADRHPCVACGPRRVQCSRQVWVRACVGCEWRIIFSGSESHVVAPVCACCHQRRRRCRRLLGALCVWCARKSVHCRNEQPVPHRPHVWRGCHRVRAWVLVGH